MAEASKPAPPARTAGAYVVLAGAEPVLYVERGGKGLQILVAEDDERVAPASRRSSRPCSAAACAGWRSSASTASRSSARPTRSALLELGFRAGPRKLTLTA